MKAAESFNYRLPEVFAGYSRERYTFPVRYPTSSSPQAWASSTPVLLLRTMLGLEPDREQMRLIASPLLPKIVNHIELRGVRAFRNRYDILVEGEYFQVAEVALEGEPARTSEKTC